MWRPFLIFVYEVELILTCLLKLFVGEEKGPFIFCSMIHPRDNFLMKGVKLTEQQVKAIKHTEHSKLIFVPPLTDTSY